MNALPASIPAPASTDYAGHAEWKDWRATAFMNPSPPERSYYAAELRGLDLTERDVLELGFGNPAHPAGAVERLRTLAQRAHEIALQRLYGHSTPLGPNSVAILRRRPRAGLAPAPRPPHIQS